MHPPRKQKVLKWKAGSPKGKLAFWPSSVICAGHPWGYGSRKLALGSEVKAVVAALLCSFDQILRENFWPVVNIENTILYYM